MCLSRANWDGTIYRENFGVSRVVEIETCNNDTHECIYIYIYIFVQRLIEYAKLLVGYLFFFSALP